MVNKWDLRFIEVAALVASWSKDPSTQVGAVVVRPNRTIAGLGYNGFPRGVADTEARYQDRELKYRYVVHAEINAIISAGEPVSGMTLYCTMFPCCECAKLIIQAGITQVVVPYAARPERYAESMAAAEAMFVESGVIFRQI